MEGAECSDAAGSEGSFANTAPCNEKTSFPSAVETDAHAHEPVGLHTTGPCNKTVADLDGQCSSDHSSQDSVPQGPKPPKDFNMLQCLTEDGQRPEWTCYPRSSGNIHTYHVGKQCFFNGIFLGNRRSLSERTVDKILGRKKYVTDPRNGIPKLNPGDNSYAIPERSKGFYKAGATLPPVNFALVPFEKKFDTFIPLEPFPQIPNLSYWEKEKANNLENEIKEVEDLEYWQPAPTLIQSIFYSGGFTASSEKARIKYGVKKSRVLTRQKKGVRKPSLPWNEYASDLEVHPGPMPQPGTVGQVRW